MGRCTRAGFALAVLMALPGLAAAQGSIAGAVRDSSGALLPGVTVEASSPALLERTRSVSTDGSGQYKILDLRPGTYDVTFTLSGFTTVKQSGIELTGTFVATVNAELRVGSIAETVTVSAETPIVDVQSATRQQTFTQAVMDALPAGRSHLDIAVLIPGLSATQPGRGALADIGGTNNLQNTSISIHGGRSGDTRIQIDGVRIGNIGGEFTNFVPDMGSAQEVTVDYAAITAEQPFGGLRVDIIPRDGGNSFKGMAFLTAVNSAWQGNNLTSDLVSRGLPAPNQMKRAYDVNPSFGGPIKRDKLWFYSSARWQENENYVAGLYYNANAGDPAKWLYVPDTSRQGFFHLDQHSLNSRLTWQAAQKHKFAFYYDNQWRVWDDGRAAVSPESFVAYRFPALNIAQANWTAPVTSRLLLEVKFSNRRESFGNKFPPEGGDIWLSMIPVMEQSTGLQYRGKGGDGGASALFGFSDQNIHNFLSSMSYVTGAHALKVGFTDMWLESYSTSVSNNSNLYFRFNNGVPNQLTMYGTPTRGASLVKGEIGAYVQDRWTLQRLTLNAGLRYDQFIGGYPEQYLGPVMYQPTRDLTFPATTGNNIKDITPRLGAVYDLFGNGKTALKASIGKYVLTATAVGNPAGITNTVTRTWTDANGNFNPDCNLLNLQQQDLRSGGGDFCGVVSSLNFGLPTSVTAFNPDTRFGWGNRLYNWEVSAGVQHQLSSRVALDVGYFRRWFGNFTTTVNRATTSADYDPYSVVVPLDPRLPGGGGNVLGGFYNLNPAKVGLTDNYTTFTNDFGKQIEHWNGVDASVNARLRNGFIVQGGISTGRTHTNNCEVAARSGGNPSQVFCDVSGQFLTQFKSLASYTVPKVDVRFAATFQSTPGPSILANTIYTSAQVQPSLGRPLSGGAANVTINTVEPGTMYGDRTNQIDLRFSKLFKLNGRIRPAVNLDVSNVLNASPVMQQNNSFAVWQTPQRIMDARLFKLSAQIDF